LNCVTDGNPTLIPIRATNARTARSKEGLEGLGTVVTTIIVLALILAGAAAYALWQAPGFAERIFPKRSNAKQLQRRYGREYDRLLTAHGDHAAVEQELGRRERDRAGLSIKALDGADRDRLTAEWSTAQAGFVDDPGAAARRAEQLIGETLALRGYPAGDPERQLALASVDHAHSLAEFRDGHELLQRSQTGTPDVDATEQLRQAMLRFRVFFDDLAGRVAPRAALQGKREKVAA
jgi:hypothetical protein